MLSKQSADPRSRKTIDFRKWNWNWTVIHHMVNYLTGDANVYCKTAFAMMLALRTLNLDYVKKSIPRSIPHITIPRESGHCHDRINELASKMSEHAVFHSTMTIDCVSHFKNRAWLIVQDSSCLANGFPVSGDVACSLDTA
jgi:hypothetical protein